MAIGYVDAQTLAVGTGVTGFSTASFWPSNTWGVAASGSYKYVKKLLSVSFDMLRYVAQGTSLAGATESCVRCWLPSPVTGGTLFGVAYSGSANGWGMDIVASTIQISKLTGGSYATVGSPVTYASPAPAAGTRLIARVRWEPGASAGQGTLRGKLWLEGDAEPAGWMLTQTRTDWPVGTGNFAPGIETFSTNTVEWDFWGWATAGDTAPLPGQAYVRSATATSAAMTVAALDIWGIGWLRSAVAFAGPAVAQVARAVLIVRSAGSFVAAVVAGGVVALWLRGWAPCADGAATEWEGCGGGEPSGLIPGDGPVPSGQWQSHGS